MPGCIDRRPRTSVLATQWSQKTKKSIFQESKKQQLQNIKNCITKNYTLIHIVSITFPFSSLQVFLPTKNGAFPPWVPLTMLPMSSPKDHTDPPKPWVQSWDLNLGDFFITQMPGGYICSKGTKGKQSLRVYGFREYQGNTKKCP